MSIAGISDLAGMAYRESRNRGGRKDYILEQIGDPNDENVYNELKRLSAINQLDKIKSPILLVHGKNYTQVNHGQSMDFYKAAKRKNLDVEYIEFEYGTHYLDEEQNRVDAFKEIERFLQEHLN